MKLGIFYSCYKEKNAVEYSISELRKIYKDNPIYLVSDGGLDFKYLENQYDNIRANLDVDTMSDTFKITDRNFTQENHQISMKKCVFAVLDRLEKAINFCQSDYILMMDPDTLVRGELNIPDGVELLGSRINRGFPEKYKNILRGIDGAKVIDHWGATPAIFKVSSFKKSLEFIKNNKRIFDEFCMSFYAMYAHDVLLPTLFAIIGHEETFNPDIIECNRDRNWRNGNRPLVHQFKEYY